MTKKKAKISAIVIFLVIVIISFSLFFLTNFEGIFGLTIYEFVNEGSNQTNETLIPEANQSIKLTFNETLIEEINKTEIIKNETNLTEIAENITLINITEVNITDNITAENITDTNLTKTAINITFFNETSIIQEENNITSNITGIITANITNFTILEEKPLHRVVIRQPVRWVKKVITNETNTTLSIPINATDITVNKILDGIKSEVNPENIAIEGPLGSPNNLITGFVILDFGESFLSDFFKKLWSITGLTIYEFVNEGFQNQTTALNETPQEPVNLTEQKNEEEFNNSEEIEEVLVEEEAPPEGEVPIGEETKNITISEEADELEIEYTLPGPEVTEENISSGRRITVFSDVNYTDILAYTAIEEARPDSIKLYHLVNNSRELVNNSVFNDTNSDGLIDYVEWTIPHLSSQTYELIIEISNALHLDSNRDFISVIYDEVKSLDNVWSEPIYTNEFVRVNFSLKLDNTRDITVYARNNESLNTYIEFYTYNSTIAFAQSELINEERYYKTLLTNLTGQHQEFDLKIISTNYTFLEFDHIIDPGIGNLSCEVANSGAFADRTEVLRISNRSNGHAALPNQTDYSLSVYCQDTTGRNTLGNSSGTNFLVLSNSTNAHVAESNTSFYDFNAYISSNPDRMVCNYTTGSGSCGNGETCLATISNITNAHISDCSTDPYQITICCGFTGNITSPAFSSVVNNTLFKRYFNASMNLTLEDNTDIANYTFSWNESGSFVNDTAVQLAGTQTTWFVNISKNVTNAVYNQRIQWRVYSCDPFNDCNTSATENMTVANTLSTSINQSYIIQSTYSNTLKSFFNSSFNDVDQNNATLTVVIESNYTGTPTNYTANNITKGIYNYSAILPAGTHTRRWCATDSASAVNCTNLETFTVSKLASNITLLLDNVFNNLSVTTGADVNITVNLTVGIGFVELYNAGIFIANSSRFPYSNLSTFGTAGTFNITAFIFGDQNSSFNFTTLYVTASTPPEEPTGGGEVPPVEAPPEVPPPVEAPPEEAPPEGEVPVGEEIPPEQLPEELKDIPITEEPPSTYSSNKENDSITTTIDNSSKLNIIFDTVFEDGKIQKKPKIDLEFGLGEECVGCLKEESPKVIYPIWLWVLLALLIALLLLLLTRAESSYKEELYRRRVLPLRFVVQTKVKKFFEVLGYFAYAFIAIPYHLIKSVFFTIADFIFYLSEALYYIYRKSLALIKILFIKRELPTYDYLKKSAKSLVRDIKDIFTLSDELVKDSYMRLKYYEIVRNLKNEANKVDSELQLGDYKKTEQKLREIRFSFCKIPKTIREQEEQFDKQLDKLEHSIEIGFLVDQAIRCLERKLFNKAQRLLDRVSHYAFIPEGVISNKYFNCIRYYEHFLYRQQYSNSLNKIDTLLTNKRLKPAIIHYGRFVDASKKLSWYEDTEGKQELYNDLSLLHKKLHFLFLRQSAEEKARGLKFIQVQFDKLEFPRIDFALPPYILHFNEKLEKAYSLIKTKNAKKASVKYHELVEFYNSLEGIGKKESNWMFSNLIKLKHYILSEELLDSIKDIKPIARREVEETKVKLKSPDLSKISTRLYSQYIRLKNSLNLKDLYEKAHERIRKAEPKPLEITKVELPEQDKDTLLEEQRRALHELKTSSELQELKQKATEKIGKAKYSEIGPRGTERERETIRLLIGESVRDFNTKLDSVYEALKENRLALARRKYETIVRFYNGLTGIEDQKILSDMYSKLIKLRSELEAKLIKKRLRNVK